jgi:hypothetical protein
MVLSLMLSRQNLERVAGLIISIDRCCLSTSSIPDSKHHNRFLHSHIRSFTKSRSLDTTLILLLLEAKAAFATANMSRSNSTLGNPNGMAGSGSRHAPATCTCSLPAPSAGCPIHTEPLHLTPPPRVDINHKPTFTTRTFSSSSTDSLPSQRAPHVPAYALHRESHSPAPLLSLRIEPVPYPMTPSIYSAGSSYSSSAPSTSSWSSRTSAVYYPQYDSGNWSPRWIHPFSENSRRFRSFQDDLESELVSPKTIVYMQRRAVTGNYSKARRGKSPTSPVYHLPHDLFASPKLECKMQGKTTTNNYLKLRRQTNSSPIESIFHLPCGILESPPLSLASSASSPPTPRENVWPPYDLSPIDVVASNMRRFPSTSIGAAPSSPPYPLTASSLIWTGRSWSPGRGFHNADIGTPLASSTAVPSPFFWYTADSPLPPTTPWFPPWYECEGSVQSMASSYLPMCSEDRDDAKES